MLLGSAAVAAALSLGGPLTDLNDQLDAETKADEKAADEAKCWCKSVQEVIDDRLRNSESEVSQLERIRDSRFYENVGLNVEVKQHSKQIAEHSRSLQASGAILDKASKSHSGEKEETAQALSSLKKALDIVPKGNQLHGTLKGLEDSFASKLKQATEDHERQQSQFKDMNEAKTDMLKLAEQSKDNKMRRLAEGKVIIAQAKSDIAAYSGQRDADYGLQSSLQSVCGKLAGAATQRTKLRQDTMIALSEEKAKVAQNNAMKAMSKVMLLKSKSVVKTHGGCSKVLQGLGEEFQGDCSGVKDRAEDLKKTADENLAGARKSAADLMKLMDKSTGVQADMSKVLSNVFMNSHLATTKGKLDGVVKGKVTTYGETADADKKAAPALYDQVRAKAKACTLADMKVVTSLQMGAATAGSALVEAKKCK